jgi:hypothetical protein
MNEETGLLVAQIIIERRAMPNGDLVDIISAVDGNGEPLGLAEALGMMRLAERRVIAWVLSYVRPKIQNGM